MESPLLSVRIPQELYDALSKYIDEQGVSKKELVVNAVCSYIGYELPDQNEPQGISFAEQLKSLTLEVETIKKTIESFFVNSAVNRSTNSLQLPTYDNISESEIASLTGISKPKLKEHREKISRGEKSKDSKLRAKINQQYQYEIQYCGEQKTKRPHPTQLWSAKPKEN